MTKSEAIIKLHNETDKVKTLPSFVAHCEKDRGIKEDISEAVIFAQGQKLIVRSSCRAEDNFETSNAGRFESVLNVEPDEQNIAKAIETVYASYGDLAGDIEEVLIQPMLDDIIKSGVVFTQDIYTGAPYYCIDYYIGSDTTAITSGSGNEDKMTVLFKGQSIEEIWERSDDPDVAELIRSVIFIEEFFASDALDIEFGITPSHEVYIFQVRPIATKSRCDIEASDLSFSLSGISKKIDKLMHKRPFVAGKTTCFGVMPDWNPAEILGVRPKKLAISLYKELITDNIWAHQRESYGYKDLTGSPLMVLFCGIPYIDTRITFNSFIPASLSDGLTEKLVDYYQERLKSHPQYHDKIEFEIVFSCYYIGMPDILRKLTRHGFSENECKRIEYALLEITNNIIDPTDGLYREDIEKIEKLKISHEMIMNSDISTVDKIYWLIEECKTNGTLPFAGVARAAFVAVQLFRSFVEAGLIEQTDYDAFMQSLNTISKQMGADRNNLSKHAFIEKYGHIRPGTYDIESPRYADAYEYYFRDFQSAEGAERSADVIPQFYIFSAEKIQRIDKALEENGINADAQGILRFAKEAIEGREYLKFIFTRTVSEILRQIETYGDRLGISREDMAHLDIHEIKQLYSDLYSGNIYDIFMENIRENKAQYHIARSIKLPSLIISPKDVYAYVMQDEEPNFITSEKVLALVIPESEIHDKDLEGRIVCIKAADPGYDFLFTKGIAGLITQFGGANSHMAIRCAELGIPAVIGAGEKNYNVWSGQKTLLIDAGNKQVKILR